MGDSRIRRTPRTRVDSPFKIQPEPRQKTHLAQDNLGGRPPGRFVHRGHAHIVLTSCRSRRYRRKIVIRRHHLKMASRYVTHRLRKIHAFEVQANLLNACHQRCLYCRCPEVKTELMTIEQMECFPRTLLQCLPLVFHDETQRDGSLPHKIMQMWTKFSRPAAVKGP